jgi:hypothetical protein
MNSPSAEIIGKTPVDLRKHALLGAISVTKSNGHFHPRNQVLTQLLV